MKSGVPFHIAFGTRHDEDVELLPHEQFAMVVVFGELGGDRFNWDARAWEDPN